MNGLIFADLTPKPQYYEVKKVYQNVGIKMIDSASYKIEIFNKNYFSTLENYQIKWTLFEDGKPINSSTGFIQTKNIIAPRQRSNYNLPIETKNLKPTAEYFVKIQLLLNEDMPWAKKGYAQMEEQLLIKSASLKPSIATMANGIKASVATDGISQTLTGNNYEVKFDLLTGSIASLKYGNKVVIRDGEGPKLDALRAPVDNDNWAYKQWFEEGLHQLKHQVLSFDTYFKPDGSMVLAFTVQSQAPYGSSILGGTSGTYTLVDKKEKPFDERDFKIISNQIYTVYKDGSIELASHISSNKPSLVLPHIGYKLELPSEYNNFDYYGRGPINNYADRKTAQFIEWHKSKVADLMVPWPNPQSTGNREEVRWCALTDSVGDGAVFISKNTFAASALPWSELELTLAPHQYQLPKSTGTHLYLNDAVTGLGGNSCGQGPPLEKDRVKANSRRMGFIIRPIIQNNFENQTNVSTAGDSPIAINRDQKGLLTLQSELVNEPIMYKINNGATQLYQGEINFINGGVVTAWYKNNDKFKFSTSFNKINTIPMSILYVSSEEQGEGYAKHLLDGDLATIWHSMYSVTVAQYPHWIDLDAGDIKTITGFKYTPRQDGTNGNIKEYKFQVSNDAKTWSDALASGAFEKSNKTHEIRLKIPVKARYVRFTALSSQNGQDFASGAEFSVLTN
jgi:beta-galactosidase